MSARLLKKSKPTKKSFYNSSTKLHIQVLEELIASIMFSNPTENTKKLFMTKDPQIFWIVYLSDSKIVKKGLLNLT